VNHPALLVVIVAALIIVFGRVTRRNLIAIAGYLLLAIAAVVAIATR
jgi:hypothetical protein